jgi:hypothetical protein
MTLKQWADNGWLESHATSAKEIANLLEIVDRDLADAGGFCPSRDSLNHMQKGKPGVSRGQPILYDQ